MRRLAILAFAILVSACAAAPNVKTQVEPGASFSGYRTYTWLAKPQGTMEDAQQRIVGGIDARLQSKGWKLAANGDVRVVANVTTTEKQDLDKLYGPGWGGFGAPVPGVQQANVDSYDVGTLVVEMFDASNKRRVWRGTASGTLPDDSTKLPALLDASLDKMFAGFPPDTAAK